MGKSEEWILVFPAAVLHEVGYFQGFCDQPQRYLEKIFSGGQAMFRPRGAVERDPTLKQLIPYVILKHGSSVFRYTRSRRGNEERLHALYSIGAGGHISRDDRNLFDTVYETALRRELEEEVLIAEPYEMHTLGVINDDSNPVGQVHFGVVHLLELQSPQVERRESALGQTQFVALDALRQDWDRYETWSQLCIEHLEKVFWEKSSAAAPRESLQR